MSDQRPAASRGDIDQVEFDALKREVDSYVRDQGEQWAQHIERENEAPLALWEQLRDRGYLRLAAPKQDGGYGIALPRYLQLLELFAMSHASLRMIVHVSNGIWRPLKAYGNAEQHQRFTLPLIAGELKVAFALTEPGSGTGADLQCSVVRDGDHYLLSGEKHLITFGTIADYLLLFARLQGSTGAEGMLALLVPPSGDGVEARLMPPTLGVRGTDHAHLVFHNARVPVVNRLGAEGEGLDVALKGFLVPSRISLAMSCVGLSRRALELAVAHAQQRETFGRKIAHRQAVAFKLAEMATEIEAARQLTLHAANTWERGEESDAVALSAMAKLFASEMLQRVTDSALHVHGGIGYFESPIERVYRDARAQRFEEGTAEIQKTTIVRELLR